MIKIIIKSLLLIIISSHYVNANNLVCRSPLVIQSLIKEDQDKAQPISDRVSLETIKKIEFEYDIIITKLKTKNNLSCFGKAKIKIPSDVLNFFKNTILFWKVEILKQKNLPFQSLPTQKRR
ncbi:hypothetical protein [Pectobacterium versatile]|uniref:hypothetical protein n=1 Tax=Pectobacterium versatile TaxID=2488639 RepID=UPI001E563A9F|nr:hypothetical protein [Pectobacterium versatile]